MHNIGAQQNHFKCNVIDNTVTRFIASGCNGILIVDLHEINCQLKSAKNLIERITSLGQVYISSEHYKLLR